MQSSEYCGVGDGAGEVVPATVGEGVITEELSCESPKIKLLVGEGEFSPTAASLFTETRAEKLA